MEATLLHLLTCYSSYVFPGSWVDHLVIWQRFWLLAFATPISYLTSFFDSRLSASEDLVCIFTPPYTLFLLLFSTTLFELLTPFISSNASRFMAEPSGSEFYIKVKPAAAATAVTHFWFAVSNFLPGAALYRHRSVTFDHPWPLLLADNHLLLPLLLPSGGNFMATLNPFCQAIIFP